MSFLSKGTTLWAHLGRALTIAASLAIVLASFANAANRNPGDQSLTERSVAADATAATHESAMPDFVGAVLASLAGGSSQGSVARNGRGKTAKDSAATTNGRSGNEISAATTLAHAGTIGTRPGWGCGDKNHAHSGPPGRPGATPPPGCSKGPRA